MARKPKERKVPIVNKEYIWTLEVDGENHEFKVFVGEDECITYADGVECKRLKIMDKRQIEGVLQIDCETRVLDEITGFQLENGIPYIKVEDEEGDRKWTMSDTTHEDRLQQKIRMVKKEAYGYACIGVLFFLIALGQKLITGHFDEVFMIPIMGIFCFTCCGLQLVRLRNELLDLGRTFTWKL
jgi:hypothetical protein